MLNIGNARLSATIDRLSVVSPNENHSTEVFTSWDHPFAYSTPDAITDTSINKVDTMGVSHMNLRGINNANTQEATGIASASNTNVIIDDSWISFKRFLLDR
jgi:hypothetical protein